MAGHIEGADRSQPTFLPDCLDDWVAGDAMARVIDAFVARLDLDDLGFLRARAASTGRPPYHPGDLLRLYIYGYLNQIRSSRRLEREACRNLELVWLLRRLTPDFKTIADFRRDNLAALTAACRAFVLFCREAGIVQDRLVAIDGSHVAAAASRRQAFGREVLGKVVERIDAAIAAHLRAMDAADGDGGADEGAAEADPQAERAKRAAALDRLQDRKAVLIDAATEDPRPTVIVGEAEACLMPHSSPVPRQPGYNVQLAVDTGSGVIIHHDLVGNANDAPCLVPMAKAVASVLANGGPAIEVVADAGYASAGAAAELENAGVVTILPMRRGRTPPGYYGRDRFSYDAEADLYVCPAGENLQRFSRKPDKDDLHRYRTAPGVCQACPLKASCTPARRREVNRSVHAAALERAAARAAARPEAMHARKTTVEPTFGTLKRRFAGRFLLRGRAKAAGEMALAVLAHNIARVATVIGIRQLREALA